MNINDEILMKANNRQPKNPYLFRDLPWLLLYFRLDFDLFFECLLCDLEDMIHSEKWQLLVNTLKNHFFKSNRLILRGYVSEGILDIEYFENLDWPNLRIVGFSLLWFACFKLQLSSQANMEQSLKLINELINTFGDVLSQSIPSQSVLSMIYNIVKLINIVCYFTLLQKTELKSIKYWWKYLLIHLAIYLKNHENGLQIRWFGR